MPGAAIPASFFLINKKETDFKPGMLMPIHSMTNDLREAVSLVAGRVIKPVVQLNEVEVILNGKTVTLSNQR